MGRSQTFRRVLLKIGLVDSLHQRQQEGTKKRKVSEYSFHSFRHTFKSNLANKGVASEVYDVLTGHRKPSVAEGYVHGDIDNLYQAIHLLPRLVAWQFLNSFLPQGIKSYCSFLKSVVCRIFSLAYGLQNDPLPYLENDPEIVLIIAPETAPIPGIS